MDKSWDINYRQNSVLLIIINKKQIIQDLHNLNLVDLC